MIDTNVILDDILDRVPGLDTAREINRLVIDGQIDACITANCVTDIFYIVTRNRDKYIARRVTRNILKTFQIISVDGDDCETAIDLPMSDFEDALVLVCAEKAKVDYIITNDKDFLSEDCSNVILISPADFLLRFQNE